MPLKLQWAVINVERLEARFDVGKKRKIRNKRKRERERRGEGEGDGLTAKLDVLIKRKAS